MQPLPPASAIKVPVRESADEGKSGEKMPVRESANEEKAAKKGTCEEGAGEKALIIKADKEKQTTDVWNRDYNNMACNRQHCGY